MKNGFIQYSVRGLLTFSWKGWIVNILQELLWKIYLEAFELVFKCLVNRFEQEYLKKYENFQQVLILAAVKKNSDSRLDQVYEFFYEENLKVQLEIFSNIFNQKKKNLCYGDVITYFKWIKPEFQDLIPEVCKILSWF